MVGENRRVDFSAAARQEEMNELRQALGRFLERSSFERFRDTVQPLFADLISSGFAERSLLRDLECLAGTAATGGTSSGVFFDDALGRLAFGYAPPQSPPTLNGSPGHLIGGVVSGRVVVKRYRHISRQDPAILDTSCGLEPLPDVELRAGEVLAAEAWVDVVEPYGEGLLLILRSAPVYSTCWAYDRVTLRPCALMAGSQVLARVTDALGILKHVGGAEDAAVCLRLADHAAHAVRWEALKTAFALDHPRAMTRLRNALGDPHPDIREAAAGVIQQWN